MTEKTRIRMMPFSLTFGFFLIWEALCVLLNVSDLVLPRPSEILVTLWVKLPILLPHILQTLYSTLTGFVLGVAIGIALGVMVGTSKVAYAVAYPLLVGFSSIPKVAVVPVLYFGSDQAPPPRF